MTTCVVCQTAEPADGWTSCQPCLGRIDHDLERIAKLTRLASGALTPEQRPSTGGSTNPAGSRPPIDLAALDAALGADVLPILESWERLIREEASLVPYGVATEAETVTVGSSVAWLQSWLLWAVERADFPLEELAREVREAARSLNRYDPELTPARTGVRLGCVAEHPDADGRQCGYRLTTNGRDAVVCPRCRTSYTTGELLDHYDDELLPAAVLILLDEREPTAARKRIEYLESRGKLLAVEYAPRPGGGKPVALYALGQYRKVGPKSSTAA